MNASENARHKHPTSEAVFNLRNFILLRGGELVEMTLGQIVAEAEKSIGWKFTKGCVSKYMRRAGLQAKITRAAKKQRAESASERLKALEGRVLFLEKSLGISTPTVQIKTANHAVTHVPEKIDL